MTLVDEIKSPAAFGRADFFCERRSPAESLPAGGAIFFRTCKVRIEFDGFVVVGKCPFVLLQAVVSDGAIVVRVGIIRVESYGFVVILNRPLVLIEPVIVSDAAIDVRRREIRI